MTKKLCASWLWLTPACVGSPENSESAPHESGASGSHSGETDACGDSSGSSDWVMDTSTYPLDESVGMDLCGEWSGVRDSGMTHATWKGAGSDSEFMSYSLVYSDTAGAVLQGGSGFGPYKSESLALFRWDASFSCAVDGLRQEDETANVTAFYSETGTPADLYTFSGVLYTFCTEEAPLLIPRELSEGDTWTTACRGYGYFSLSGSSDPIDCELDLTAGPLETIDTFVGRFEVIPISVTACTGFEAYFPSFKVARYAGVVQIDGWELIGLQDY